MKLALSLLTCDRPELVEQSIKPLLAGALEHKYHLFVCDGSTSEKNEKAIWEMSYPTGHVLSNVRGGAGAAIVYALTMMLQHQEGYTHVGLVESDVLLLDGWLDCLGLFSLGTADGLEVGAVSARAYVDRVLFQRDGYAAMHNLGAGQIIFTREAAQIVLKTFRTGWTTDNRRIFSQLCGVDIGAFWAFRGNEHYTTADWCWDAHLAAHGFASLALTPSPVEMIGQNPPLAEQGLTLANSTNLKKFDTFELAEDSIRFVTYRQRLEGIRDGVFQVGVETQFHLNPANGTWTYFPHQMAMLGGVYSGDWRFGECRGWGTFKWVAGEEQQYPGEAREMLKPTLSVPVFGSCSVLVSGGATGGTVEVIDEQSGFKASPELPPEGEQGQVLQLMVPGNLNYRNIRITALEPGIVFYGIQTRDKQPCLPHVSFDHATLPSV